MKKLNFVTIIMLVLMIAAGCSAPQNTPSAEPASSIDEALSTNIDMAKESSQAIPKDTGEEKKMIVTSAGIVNGYIDPAYGAKGNKKENGVPVLSLPLEITNAPKGTVSYAIFMEDPDAKPLSGHNWIHWMAANIKESSIPEDFSQKAGDTAVQGKNDDGMIGYAGPNPPDKDHTYIINVYALVSDVKLKDGFSKQEFAQAIKDKILATATITGIYKK